MISKITLVIDPSVAVSHAINSVLRKEGVTDLHVASSFKEAETILQRHKIEWIITAAAPSSGLSLLDFLAKLYQKTSTPRVSAFFQKQELKLIPEAFALGLLSWHASFFSIKRIKEEIQTLFSRLKDGELDTAALYLKDYLTAIKNTKEVANLMRSIASHDPENHARLLPLAESLFLNNEFGEARSALAKATYFSPLLTKSAIEIEKKYPAEVQKVKILLIDGDDVSNAQVKSSLSSLSTDIEVLHTADNILPLKEEPDIILTEWKLRGLHGQKFIQRLRSANHLMPIVVISSSLSQEDEKLARECSISRIVPKPFSKDELLSAVKWALAQHKAPSEYRTIEDKVIASLKQKNIPEAKRFLSTYKGNRRLYLEGAIAYHERQFKAANEKLIQYLKESRGERDVDAISYLSKTLVELNAYEAAMALANKAFDLSPKNIERACDVASILYKIGRDKDAEIATNIAGALDRDNHSVVKLVASKAIIDGDLPQAKSLLSKLGDIDSVVSIMNNRAVSLVRDGKKEEAEKLYKETLRLGGNSDCQRTVEYNLALHYVRVGKNKDAEECLKRAMDGASRDYVSKDVYKKAASLYKRIRGKDHLVPLRKGEDDEVSHLYLYELTDLVGNGRYRHLADKGVCLGFIYIPLDPGNVDVFEPGDDFTISEDGLSEEAAELIEPEQEDSSSEGVREVETEKFVEGFEYEDITETLGGIE